MGGGEEAIRCPVGRKFVSSGMKETLEAFRGRLVKVLEAAPREPVRLPGYSPAAVLVPVLLDADAPELLFTKRTDDVETHKGQVSFPGGVCDDTDAGPVDTALRETEEELGIPRSLVEVVGCLPELKTPTGFSITPVVGLLSALPRLTPSAAEVAAVFRAPLALFAGGRSEMRMVDGVAREVWFYDHHGTVIWGATAAIARTLHERTRLLP
jgi:8-oxo-dGTP pyrophosphatase MutT (NUDIX family)